MSIIRFEDPPPDPRSRNGSQHWHEVASQLRSRPGEWALIAEGVSSQLAISIQRGVIKAFRPAGSFEALTRNTSFVKGSRRADIYARYVGEVP